MVCTGIDGGKPDRSADRCAPPAAYIRGISVFKEIYLPDQRSSDGPYVDRTRYFALSSVRGDFWDSLLHCDGCCGDLSDLHNCDRLQFRIYLVSYICRTMEVVHHAKEMEMLQKFYDERLKEEERVRAVYHDMKNHLLLLEARTGHQEETQEMIQRLQEKVEDYENYIQTGNAYLDIILRDKMRLAKESRIDVQAEVEFSKGKFIDGLDISTIFGNAWDNAMEACMKLPEEQRFITVRAGVRNQFLIVKFENSAKESDLEIPTTKADTFMHGFGKKNIQKAVEKYQGSCQWDYTEGIYSLSILIPMTEEK